jgi:aminopeptidase N
MRVRTLAFAAAALVVAAPVGADTYPRQPGIDAIHYVFRLTVEDASNRIIGETTMTFRLTAAVPELWLDLASATPDGKGMTVTAVTVAGTPASYAHAKNRLRIPLPSTAKPGAELQAVVTYSGIPANGLRLIPNIHGERTMFSENWPNRAREWLPMIDHPYDKATGEFIVSAPAHYQVIANGRLIEEVDVARGVRRTHWDDVWLSEGFATYFTHLFNEHFNGRDAFVRGLKEDIPIIIAGQKAMPDEPVIHRNLSDMEEVLNRLVYQKGGWVLHMLRGTIGTDKFWTGIREYYRRYQNQNASTDDFRQVMEATSGTSLSWFFDQWLERPGMPSLRGSWRYDAAAKQVRIELSQVQGGAPYRLPLEIGLMNGSSQPRVERVEKVELSAATGQFQIAAAEEPSSVTLDPNTWMLMQVAEFARR